MPATPVYAFPYPAPADPADVPTDLHELALQVETVLGGVAAPPAVDALPGSPTNGQEVYFRPDPTGSPETRWHLRYNAAGGTYKWEVLGGPPLVAPPIGTEQALSATSYVDLATPGPLLTLARPGLYVFRYGAACRNNAVPASGRSMWINVNHGAAMNDDDAARLFSTTGITGSAPARERTGIVAAAGQLVKLQYKAGATDPDYRVGNRWLTVTGVAIG